MDDMVYVCRGCRKTFLGGKFRWWESPNCPECGKKIVSTGKTRERWMSMTKEERKQYVDDIFGDNSEPETTAQVERRPEQKRDEGVVDFVNARIGVVQGIKTVLTILFWICVFIFMVALASDEMAMAAPGLIRVSRPLSTRPLQSHSSNNGAKIETERRVIHTGASIIPFIASSNH